MSHVQAAAKGSWLHLSALGLEAVDIAFLRYVSAALVMLLIFLRQPGRGELMRLGRFKPSMLAALAGPGLFSGQSEAWKGDIPFATAGTMVAGFTILVRRWRISPRASRGPGSAACRGRPLLPCHRTTSSGSAFRRDLTATGGRSLAR